MLIRFQVSNHRSIREPVELSMVAIDADRLQVRPEPMLGLGVLPITAIYGPNASGKSNLLGALSWLLEAVSSSLQTWQHVIPVDQFASAGEGEPTSFEIELTVSGVRYEYVVELTQFAVQYEALFYYPARKRRRIFEREANLTVKTMRGLQNIASARKLLTDQTLFLTVAGRWEASTIVAFVSELLRFQAHGPIPARPWPLAGGGSFTPWSRKGLQALDLFYSPPPAALVARGGGFADPIEAVRQQALGLLRLADLGIEDVVVYPQEVRSPDGEVIFSRSVVRFGHMIAESRTDFPVEDESGGTRAWIELIGPTLQALQTGSVLLVDELDASLHPKLSAELLRLFGNPETNPRGAQLIFTTHDTSLLSYLNRDEVWLCEKRSDGSTRLGALSDFAGERVRKSVNLEAGYLAGRFGALPRVNQIEFLRSLGLL